MEAKRANSVSACWTWEMEKCVSKTVALSGASRRAAKGLFWWSAVAVFCSSKQVSNAVSICNGVKGSTLVDGAGALGLPVGVSATDGSAEFVEDAGVDLVIFGTVVGLRATF